MSNIIICISDPIKRAKVLSNIKGRYTHLKALDQDHLALLIQQQKPKRFVCEMVQRPQNSFDLLAWQLEFQAEVYSDPMKLALLPVFADPIDSDDDGEGSPSSDTQTTTP